MLPKQLNCRIVGRGDVLVVLSSGFGTDQSAWSVIAPALAETHRVLLYDLACSGTADPDAFDLRRHGILDGYARDLNDLLDELQQERCLFIGHSVSAMIGMLAAIARPRRFTKLIMLGASARYLNDGDYHGGFEEADVTAILDAIEQDFHAWARQFAPHAIARAADDPAARNFVGSLRRMRPDIALLSWRTIITSDLRNRLKDCPVPVTLLQCRMDPAVPQSAADYLHAHLPDSVMEVLETDGHLPHLSAPHIVLPALLRHMEPAG